MAEQTREWPRLSADPVIQFCAVEALSARLAKMRSDGIERQTATETALARAKAEVKAAVS